MRPVSLAVAVLTAFVLSACGSGPAQPGAAAIIGDRTIPLDAVQQEVNWFLDNVPEAESAREQGELKLDQVGRSIVASRVVHQLVDVASAREGLRVDATEVDELIESTGGAESAARSIGVPPERLQEVAADQMLLGQLGERYVGRLSVHYVGARVIQESPGRTAKDQALDLGRRIAADPQDAAAIIREVGLAVEDQRVSLAETLARDPEFATSAVFGAREGSVLVIQPSQATPGWLVALVKERVVSPSHGDGVTAARTADPRTLYHAGLRQLQPIADELGVSINPRYGVWDSAAMTTAPSEQELTGYQLQSRTVTS